MTSVVQTVLGVISVEELGVTLAHEHVFVNTVGPNYKPPENTEDAALAEQELRPEIRAWVEANWTNHRANLVLDDLDLAIKELQRYRQAGGRSLIDMTNVGMSRSPEALAAVSRKADVHIVMGSGYYHDATHPPYVRERDEETLCAEMIRDFRVGVENTGIRSGVLGEIGCSWPLTSSERKVLRGAAFAQRELGCGLSIHPGRDTRAPHEILEIVADAGADVGRVVIGHMERTIQDIAEVKKLAMDGCFVEYDLFGMEATARFFWEQGIELPSDGQRLDQIEELIEAGLGDRVLIAQDICQNHRLCAYGGHGYEHIVRQIRPRMQARGLAEAFDQILIRNPARAFSLDPTRLAPSDSSSK